MCENQAKAKAIPQAKWPKMSKNRAKGKAIAQISYYTLFTGLRNEM